MRIILLGPPAAGKGTQAANLSAHYQIPSISTGAIIRHEIENDTPLGRKTKSLIEAGQLVPDDLVINLVKKRLAMEDCKNGYILDGFPRTVVQAEEAEKLGFGVDKVVLIEISDDEVVKRITGRRECAGCGHVYHTLYNPPATDGICNLCGGKLIGREDDTEETVRVRLGVYHSTTEPLVAYYENKGLLVKVAGQERLEDTTKEMFKALGEV